MVLAENKASVRKEAAQGKRCAKQRVYAHGERGRAKPAIYFVGYKT